jgi:hypothetical protein
MKKSYLVVLTSSVIPQLANSVKRHSPDKRLNDYIVSIERWASLSDKGSLDVLVVENSDSISELKSYLSSRSKEIVKFQSVTTPNLSDDEGISKGEFNMLKDSLIGYLDSYAFIWKCSGRNFPINCNRLLFCEGSDVIVERFTKPYFSADSRFFGMTGELWRELLSGNPSFSRSDIDPASSKFNSMEHLLTRFVTDLGFRDKVISSFPEIPIFKEKSGSLDKQIMSRKRVISLKALNRIRKTLRKVSLGYLL